MENRKGREKKGKKKKKRKGRKKKERIRKTEEKENIETKKREGEEEMEEKKKMKKEKKTAGEEKEEPLIHCLETKINIDPRKKTCIVQDWQCGYESRRHHSYDKQAQVMVLPRSLSEAQ